MSFCLYSDTQMCCLAKRSTSSVNKQHRKCVKKCGMVPRPIRDDTIISVALVKITCNCPAIDKNE